MSGEKRKRVCHGERKSKAKVLVALRIANTLSVIEETCRKCYASVPSTSIGEVMAKLQGLDDISNDPNWHSKCC